MRRILLVLTAAVMMATMLAVTAGAASATIHALSCADQAQDGTPAQKQEPPGITNDDFNGNNALQRQPILSVRDNDNSAGPNDEAEENAIGKKALRCAD